MANLQASFSSMRGSSASYAKNNEQKLEKPKNAAEIQAARASGYSSGSQAQSTSSSASNNNLQQAYNNHVAQLTTTAEYLNSGKTDAVTSQKYLQEATAARDKANQLRGYSKEWSNLASSYDNVIAALTADARNNAKADIKALKAENRNLQQQFNAANAVSQYGGTAKDKNIGDPSKIMEQISANKAKIDSLKDASKLYATNEEREEILSRLKGHFGLGSNAADAMWGGEAEAQALGQREMDRRRLKELDEQLYNGPMAYGAEERLASIVSGGLGKVAAGMAGMGRALTEAGIETRDVDDAYGQQALYNTSNEEYQRNLDSTGINLFDYNKAMQMADDAALFVRDSAQQAAEKLGVSAEREIAAAKSGLGETGQFLVDLGVNTVQIGTDMALGGLTGLGALAPMTMRVFGDEAQAAQAAGVDISTQLAYGLSKAGIEAGTEAIFGMFDKIGYGKGFASNLGWEERLINKLTNSTWGATALRMIVGAVEEGGEEVLSDLAAPFADAILSGKLDYNLDPAELAYDFLVGAAMGFAGQAVAVPTGGHAKANNEMAFNSIQQKMAEGNENFNAREQQYAPIVMEQMMAGEEVGAFDKARSGEKKPGKVGKVAQDNSKQKSTPGPGSGPAGKVIRLGAEARAKDINYMLSFPAEVAIFERETGQKIQGRTLRDQQNSVKRILKQQAAEQAAQKAKADAEFNKRERESNAAYLDEFRNQPVTAQNSPSYNEDGKIVYPWERAAEVESAPEKPKTELPKKEKPKGKNKATSKDLGPEFDLSGLSEEEREKPSKRTIKNSGRKAEIIEGHKETAASKLAGEKLALAQREFQEKQASKKQAEAEKERRENRDKKIAEQKQKIADKDAEIAELKAKLAAALISQNKATQTQDVEKGTQTPAKQETAVDTASRELNSQTQQAEAPTTTEAAEGKPAGKKRPPMPRDEGVRQRLLAEADKRETAEKKPRGKRKNKTPGEKLEAAAKKGAASVQSMFQTNPVEAAAAYKELTGNDFPKTTKEQMEALEELSGRYESKPETKAAAAEAKDTVPATAKAEEEEAKNAAESEEQKPAEEKKELSQGAKDLLNSANVNRISGKKMAERVLADGAKGIKAFEEAFGVKLTHNLDGTDEIKYSEALKKKRTSEIEEAVAEYYKNNDSEEAFITRIQNVAKAAPGSEISEMSPNERSKTEVDKITPVNIEGDMFTPEAVKKGGFEHLTQAVAAFFNEKFGGKVKTRDGFEVTLNRAGAKSDVAHGLGAAKAATFEAVPDVIKRGKVIDRVKNWKGRGTTSYIIMAPVEIQGKKTYVGCVITAADTGPERGKFYLHEVVDGDGNLIFDYDGFLNEGNLKNEEGSSAVVNTEAAEGADLGKAEEPIESIAQPVEEVNEPAMEEAPAEEAVEEPEPVKEELTPAPESEPAPEVEDEDEFNDEPEEPEYEWETAQARTRTPQNKEQKKWFTLGEIAKMRGVEVESFTESEIEEAAERNIDKIPYDEVMRHLSTIDPNNVTELEMAEAQLLSEKLTDEFRLRQTEESYVSDPNLPDTMEGLLSAMSAVDNLFAKEKSRSGRHLKFRIKPKLSRRVKNEAANILFGEKTYDEIDQNGFNAQLYRVIAEHADYIEYIPDTDVDAIVDEIKEITKLRGTDKMFGKLSAKAEAKALDYIAENDPNAAETLKTLAYGNINRITSDFMTPSAMALVNQWRYISMLSNIATIVSNVGNNATNIGHRAAGQNVGRALTDKRFTKIFGEDVSLGKDYSSHVWDARIRQAQALALCESALSLYYGLEIEDGKLDTDAMAAANMNGNAVERFLARASYFSGLAMHTTDAVAKARTLEGMKMGIEEKGIDPDSAQYERAYREAKAEADKRLFHDMSLAAELTSKARSVLNKVKIGNEKIGTIGLGDIIIPFAKVPANVATRMIEASPYGAFYGLYKYARGVHHMEAVLKAKEAVESGKATTEQKKLAEEEISRSKVAELQRALGNAVINGSVTVAGAALAAMGALRNFDDEDDDELRRMASEHGLKGLQFNVNHMAPWNWGKEWDYEHDLIIGGTWLDILALPLMIGAEIYENVAEAGGTPADKLNGFLSSQESSLADVIQACENFPGMSTAVSFFNAYENASKYNEGKWAKTVFDTAVQQSAYTVSSLIPNIWSQATAGIDNTVRDVYSADNVWQQAANIISSKAGFRGHIAPAIDAFGNERKIAKNPFMAVVNNVILPGDITKFKQSDVEKEYQRLIESGHDNIIPKKSAPKTIEIGDDFKYELTAEEQRTYKKIYTQECYDVDSEIMQDEIYKNLSDDGKQYVLRNFRALAERHAKAAIIGERSDVEVDFDKWETELNDVHKQLGFLAARYTAKSLYDGKTGEVTDYDAMDKFIQGEYGKLDKQQRDLLANSYSRLDDMRDAWGEAKIDSRTFYKAYKIWKSYDDSENGTASVRARHMSEDFANISGVSNKQARWMEDNLRIFQHIPANVDTYNKLRNNGLSNGQANDFLDAYAMLEPAQGYTNPSQNQKIVFIRDQVNAKKITEEQAWALLASGSYCSEKAYNNIAKYKGKCILAEAIARAGYDKIKPKK